ncbi:RNA-binding S4 domain-containing protein [Helicovermis profundi]|uniref:S4 domain-containing protein YaaA n=1 Tax=Helicovermis profundi TaxID=3065157 RepID=A0AAU9E7I1_9FIRM|nr:S4 domain-containing protein YaaA [Clostridia bacterium S502]
MKVIEIKTEFIKLDQFLKFSNVIGSGGIAKLIIKDGLVRVNDEVCLQRGKKIRNNDLVEISFYDDNGNIDKIIKLKVKQI